MTISNPVRPAGIPVNTQISTRAGRFVAALSAVCVIGHVPMLGGHFTTHPVATAVMVAVAALCLFCMRKLWTAPHRQDVLVAGCLATAMLGIHLFLMLGMVGDSAPVPAPGAGAHHHHGTSSFELAEMTVGHQHSMQLDGFFYVPTALAAAQILLCIGIALRARRC